MPKHYSDDIKNLVLEKRGEGMTLREITKIVNVPLTTVQKICKIGVVVPRKVGSGRKRLLSDDKLKKISSLVKKEPDITAKEVIQKLDLHIIPEQ